MSRKSLLLSMFDAMSAALGPSHWWPGDGPFETAVGAVLTQNTNWGNVEKAIANLKQAQVMTPEALYALSEDETAELIRPAGYFRVKTVRLKNLLTVMHEEFELDFERPKEHDMLKLREMLLAVKGVGPETADSILLYAWGKPSFVVDAYTRRILSRHGLLPPDVSYDEVQEYFMDVLPGDEALYNEYHALIVRTAKEWCVKKAPKCNGCPLEPFLD